MEMLKQMNLAMEYIEANLVNEINLGKVAQTACCSEYHFKRMFSFLAGIPLNEYIRLRRLSLAGLELLQSEVKIIDLALKYGYESPDSFTRAFQSFHGMTPTEIRKNKGILKAFSPMTFQITIQGGNKMDYRIVEKESFQLVGIKKQITLIYEGVNPHMEEMWASLTMEDFQELKNLSNVEPRGILCASANFTEGRAEGALLDQYIGVATTNSASERWETLDVPPGTWAVFTAIGEFPAVLQQTWARIYSEWFPSSGYELAEGPEILWNESPDTSKPDYKSEIWIPVQKR